MSINGAVESAKPKPPTGQFKSRPPSDGVEYAASQVTPLTDEEDTLGLPRRRRGMASSTLLGL